MLNLIVNNYNFFNIQIDNHYQFNYENQYRKFKKEFFTGLSTEETKEMDKLLSSFILKYINEIDTSKLINLENFLNIDDEDLYKFYNGDKKYLNFDDKYILDLFKNFKFDSE